MNPLRRLYGRMDTTSKRGIARLLAEADTARDSGNWVTAAERYEAFLVHKPERADIWGQLGNMRKDSGALQEALAAYEKALSLAPDNADTPLMIGHLYKRWEDYDAAEKAYAKALALDPSSRDAFRELSALGAFPASLPEGEVKAKDLRQKLVLLDLSDVFKFLKDYATVSGIQRVQLSMTESLLQQGRTDLQPSYLDEATRCYYTVNPGIILELAALLRKSSVDHDALKAVIARAEAEAQPYRPTAGDTVFIAGAFWMLPDSLGIYSQLKQAGVYLGVYIYDVIPVTHPEYCAQELVARFTRCLFHLLEMADFIFTISDYSGAELIRHFSDRIPDLAPVSTVRLAHQLAADPAGGPASRAIQPLLERDYVLFVSTLEARKNHAYLYRAWQLLLDKYPANKVPDLVFVGRKGWRVDDLVSSFKDSQYLDGKLHVLRNIGDADLALLYQKAQFTCFPSFMEGWGLPIGESLTFGTPCVASNTSSMPEVAGDIVDYIDPYNVSGGVAVFEQLLFIDGELEKRRARIQSAFKPVEWVQVAEDMLTGIDGHRQKLANKNDGNVRRDQRPVLSLGQTHRFEDSTTEFRINQVQSLATADFAFDGRWFWDNDQVKWLTGSRTTLSCRIAPDAAFAGRYIPVLLRLGFVPDRNPDNQVQLLTGGVALGNFTPDADVYSVICAVPVNEENCLELTITISGRLPRDSRLRPVMLCVSEFGLGSPVDAPFFTASKLELPLPEGNDN